MERWRPLSIFTIMVGGDMERWRPRRHKASRFAFITGSSRARTLSGQAAPMAGWGSDDFWTALEK